VLCLAKKTFIVFAPSYDENSGGIVVLHKLCHLINQLGYDAFLFPESQQFVFDKKSFFSKLWLFFKFELKSLLSGYKLNPSFNTPLFAKKNVSFDESYVVLYSELVLGNPLVAKNVVRWLLHQPGFHTGQVMYNTGELIFKFNSAIKDFDYPRSLTSKHELKVIHYPLNHYNTEGVFENRKGTAYCLRKGRGKIIQHDLKDSILIDDLSHAEVAAVFKKVKTFISYDTLTAYSLFAVLCGCESVVIPDQGVGELDWYPNEKDRYGIAYGLGNILAAAATTHLVKSQVEIEERKSKNNVSIAIAQVESYFNK
jgi:hypothetical protein